MTTLLFDNLERQHIIEFYKNPSYFGKSSIVARFEIKKAIRDYNRNLTKALLVAFAEKVIKAKEEFNKQNSHE